LRTGITIETSGWALTSPTDSARETAGALGR
jgi:hypothetical protein